VLILAGASIIGAPDLFGGHMKANYTHIALLLDRSGSMGIVQDDTIGGVNHYFESQRNQPGTRTVTLAQFDDQYELLYQRVALADVAPRTRANYEPRGWTALHDSIVRFIDDTGAALAKLPEHERPEHVLVVIQTDGQENSSKLYRASDVRARIEHQRDVYRWEFVFLGANQDAVLAAEKLGIGRASSMTYAANTVGTYSAMDSLARATKSYGATGQSISFTSDDRTAQLNAGAVPDVAANDALFDAQPPKCATK
jgi:hypothetical protein